jgi:hypothetical protein
VLLSKEKSSICLGYLQYAGQFGNVVTTYSLRRENKEP